MPQWPPLTCPVQITVKDAKQLPEHMNCRWAVQLWWQDSVASLVRTQPRSNNKPPLVWNEENELLVSPVQSLDLVVCAVDSEFGPEDSIGDIEVSPAPTKSHGNPPPPTHKQ